MSKIEFGELETGSETKEGLKDLLRMVADRSLAVKGPNPAAKRIQELTKRDDFVESLGNHFDDVDAIFSNAGRHYERLTLEEIIRRLRGL